MLSNFLMYPRTILRYNVLVHFICGRMHVYKIYLYGLNVGMYELVLEYMDPT